MSDEAVPMGSPVEPVEIPEPLPDTKPAQCRFCGKWFEAKLSHFMRGDKRLTRTDYWCSKKCRMRHVKKVNAR